MDAAFFNAIEATDVRCASIEANVKVDRKSDDIFQFSFTMEGTITIPCDRCLDDMQQAVATTYNLTVKEGETYDDSDDDVLVIPSAWRELDITPLMRDTVLLTIPIKHVHPEGECNAQMLERLDSVRASIADDEEMRSESIDDNNETTNDSSATDPRWDALKKLKDNN